MQDHEYSVVGHSRSNIGRYLGAIAAVVFSVLATAGIGLAGLVAQIGVPEWLNPFLSITITASIAYACVHFAFNTIGWRHLNWLCKVPDISGTWKCDGETLNEDGEVKYKWESKITITQSWEKIRVNQKTDTSSSNSATAAIIPEPDGHWTLFYTYRNQPKPGKKELSSHSGCVELQFSPDRKTAEGDYFNGKGRGTYGRMKLTKV